jgi:hypothetical protein
MQKLFLPANYRKIALGCRGCAAPVLLVGSGGQLEGYRRPTGRRMPHPTEPSRPRPRLEEIIAHARNCEDGARGCGNQPAAEERSWVTIAAALRETADEVRVQVRAATSSARGQRAPPSRAL